MLRSRREAPSGADPRRARAWRRRLGRGGRAVAPRGGVASGVPALDIADCGQFPGCGVAIAVAAGGARRRIRRPCQALRRASENARGEVPGARSSLGLPAIVPARELAVLAETTVSPSGEPVAAAGNRHPSSPATRLVALPLVHSTTEHCPVHRAPSAAHRSFSPRAYPATVAPGQSLAPQERHKIWSRCSREVLISTHSGKWSLSWYVKSRLLMRMPGKSGR